MEYGYSLITVRALVANAMLTDQQQENDAGEDSGEQFPEQQRIALDQRRGGSIEVFRVRVTKIERVFRKTLVTLVWIRMHGPP